MPWATMVPLPLSVTASSVGTFTSTLIGLFVVKLPGVFAMTSLPDCTSVVTRFEEVVIRPHDDGLLLADADHDVVASSELDIVERGQVAGPASGHARSLRGRVGRALERVELIQQRNRRATQDERQDRND